MINITKKKNMKHIQIKRVQINNNNKKKNTKKTALLLFELVILN